jgi:hypothetical protein
MNIAFAVMPSFMPVYSTLSNNDRSFIEFTRCLYKAKSVVKELEEFSKTVGPTFYLTPLSQERQYDPRITIDEFIKHVQQYLEESFRKFNHMCRVLLLVLSKLEASQPVRKERIDSFRQELIAEWRKATIVRQNLITLVQTQTYNITKLPSPHFEVSTSPIESDTTIEPNSSESP